MKGTYRSGQKKNIPVGRTNYDDWSDLKAEKFLSQVLHRTRTKHTLTDYEKKLRLDKFKTKTAYSQTEDDIHNIRLKVKQGEPLLPHKEIRQLRLPFYSGLVLNVRDEGYFLTSEYIKDLIVLDDMYGKLDPSRPLLRTTKTVLQKLAEGLKRAEDAKKKGDLNGEVQALMNLAMTFMSSENSFNWLVEELLEQSIGLLENSQYPVEPQVEASVRYLFSFFLLETHDLVTAKSQLMISMDLSRGKYFKIADIDGKGSDLLYSKSCVLLSKIDMAEAHEQKSLDITKAITSCRSALHWAKQGSDQTVIARVLLTLSEFYLKAKQFSSVPDLIREYLKLCETYMFDRELCEGYILLAKYHRAVGHDKEVVEVIEELITFAQGKGILDIVTKAHIKLAEIHGTQMIEKMKHHAVTAFKYCQRLEDKGEIDEARCVVGISQGHQLLSDFVNLMSRSRCVGSEGVIRMLDWKMFRIPFFSEKKTILYQPEIEKNLQTKCELERIKMEEMDYIHEEKLRKHSHAIKKSRTSSLLRHGTVTSTLRLKTSALELPEEVRLKKSILELPEEVRLNKSLLELPEEVSQSLPSASTSEATTHRLKHTVSFNVSSLKA